MIDGAEGSLCAWAGGGAKKIQVQKALSIQRESVFIDM